LVAGIPERLEAAESIDGVAAGTFVLGNVVDSDERKHLE